MASLALRRAIVPYRSAALSRPLSTHALNATKNGRERVLILGSGWGGFGVARTLDTRHYQPIIVTPRSYFVFTPLLAGTAVGTLEFRTAMESSHSLPGVEVIQGMAEDIDIPNKTLTIRSTVDVEEHEQMVFPFRYDKLVIAVGCYAQTFNTPGVREHAFFLRDVGHARRIRRRILSCFEQASLPTCSDERQRELLHFMIVGGGPTGVEFAAELHDLIHDDLIHVFPDLAGKSKITILDVAPTILSMFDKGLQNYARNLFAREDIEIRTSHHVVEVTADAIITKEEGRTPVGAVVWSTGLATNPFVEEQLGKPFKLYESAKKSTIVKRSRGQIKVDRHLRVMAAEEGEQPKPLDDVFALGDCAAVENENLPATAQVANQEAQSLGYALNQAAKKNKPGHGLADVSDEREFKFRSLGIMAYLGGWRAIAQTSTGDVKGRMAWLLWRTAYLTKSVSWRNRVLIPTYWFLNWILGRDINRF